MKKFFQGHNIHTLQHAQIGNHSIYRLHSAEHTNIPHTIYIPFKEDTKDGSSFLSDINLTSAYKVTIHSSAVQPFWYCEPQKNYS